MILPDVSVLIYAFRSEAAHHEAYARWLDETVNGPEELALLDTVLAGFVRIATNPRIHRDPAPTAAALDLVSALRAAPRSRWLAPSDRTWTTLATLVGDDPGIRGNLVPDGYLAATAITHGCRLATADRGFARFPGLRWFDPARDEPRPR